MFCEYLVFHEFNSVVIAGHSSSVCLTDRIFVETQVTFCEYMVFHEFNSAVIDDIQAVCV